MNNQAPTNTPPPRRKLTKKEARLFAKIYAASVVASAEDFHFEALLPGESEQLTDALLLLSSQLYDGDTMSTPGQIFAHVLALRTK
jgi:hypothetical protein